MTTDSYSRLTDLEAAALDEAETLRAELDKVRAQLADTQHRAHTDATNLQQILRDKTALANERDELKQQLAEAVDVLMANGWKQAADEMDADGGTDTRAYLIWSHHHKAWWAPNCRGYRTNVNDAGRYTLAEAQVEMRRGCGCCQVPELPIPAEKVAGAGDRSIRGVITAATRAAIKSGQVNKYYVPKAEVAR